MGTSLDTTMSLEFKKHTGKPSDFFSLLPSSWLEGLLEVWKDYRLKSEIFVLVKDSEIVTGGLVVKGIPEDMQHFLQEALFWAGKGYLYIGYLWVVEDHRNKDLGSKWLQELKKWYPEKKFWLSIEEEGLKNFYIKNGFRLVKELQNGDDHEWILVYDGLNT